MELTFKAECVNTRVSAQLTFRVESGEENFVLNRVQEQFGIHWFRRDLRVAGNSALKWNWKQNQGRTLGVFFFDSKFLSRSDFSHQRFGFFLQTLKKLQTELRELGGDLLVLDHLPDAGFEFLFSQLKGNLPSCVTWNRDYEPFARERDARVTYQLESVGVPVHTERDHLLIEPLELRKDPAHPSYYQVYSPFGRKWFSLLQEDEFQGRVAEQKEAIAYLEKKRKGETIEPFFKLTWESLFSGFGRTPEGRSALRDRLDDYVLQNAPHLNIELPPAGSLVAYERLLEFKRHVDAYLEERDFPARPGTSRLSLFLKNGSLTPSIILSVLGLSHQDFKQKTGKTQFLKEIVWREFYYHILYHRPDVETQAFLPHYRDLAWENNSAWFEAWKQGKTGYPIVDAGMRELKTTGWMHNRVRMIVASFLTKDLLIDWRWGEKHFMTDLLDGDLAPNNGGWQWAASTGCDPQPYFRIFNPLLQSQKFDPTGAYIKKYIPELRGLHADVVHAPGSQYIRPIVEHAVQKEKALALYRR